MQLESASRSDVKAEVDSSFKALRTTLRPHEWTAPDGTHIGGHYRTVMTSGAMTNPFAAGGIVASGRWTNADRAMLINRVKAWVTVGTVFGTAQELSLDIARVTNMVANDTGGTAITVGESSRKSRSNMSASQIADLRVCGAAALALGAGNVVETTPIAGDVFAGALNVVGSTARMQLYDLESGHEGPIVIQRLEGFQIRNRVAFGAGGIVVVSIEIDWSEVPTSLLGN
jgi:hypothetical protein